MPIDPFASTRVVLAPVRRGDRDALVAANRADHAVHAPFVAPFTDVAGFEAWFERHLLGPHRAFLARERASGALAGVVSLTEIVLGPLRSAYLGYYGYRSAGGRGLMTEAVGAAARLGFTEFGLERVEANIRPDNTRSIALVRRLGFRLEGVSPDYLLIDGSRRACGRWALLRREAFLPPTAADDDAPRRTADTDAFWGAFRARTGLGDDAVYDLSAFGAGRAQRNALAALVRARRKRATASLRADYAAGRDLVPAPGDLSVVVDGVGAPVAAIRVTAVRLGPFGSVDAAFAWDEGEDDRSVEGWLRAHRAGFGAIGDDADTLFTRFSVIWPDD